MNPGPRPLPTGCCTCTCRKGAEWPWGHRRGLEVPLESSQDGHGVSHFSSVPSGLLADHLGSLRALTVPAVVTVQKQKQIKPIREPRGWAQRPHGGFGPEPGFSNTETARGPHHEDLRKGCGQPHPQVVVAEQEGGRQEVAICLCAGGHLGLETTSLGDTSRWKRSPDVHQRSRRGRAERQEDIVHLGQPRDIAHLS